MLSYSIRDGDERDGPACGAIVNRWIDATEWMPRVHIPGSVIDYFTSVVLSQRRCWVGELDGTICGFLALDLTDGLLTALYLDADARGRGLGQALLDRAKAERPTGLGLWTFVANTGARRFYEREGFVEVARTDCDNEEGLPDILFRWATEIER